MRQDVFRVRFYLVGGQTVERVVPVSDGTPLTQDALNDFAKTMNEVDSVWFAGSTRFAIAVPSMKNVAMIEVEGVGVGEHI
ncbi:hypothetical protein [Methylobacterium mesophilicum]